MDLHFPAFFRMYDEPALDVLHIENGPIKDLRANFLIISDVQNFVNSLLAFSSGKVQNPIVKSCFLELAELFLDP